MRSQQKSGSKPFGRLINAAVATSVAPAPFASSAASSRVSPDAAMSSTMTTRRP